MRNKGEMERLLPKQRLVYTCLLLYDFMGPEIVMTQGLFSTCMFVINESKQCISYTMKNINLKRRYR